VWLGLRRDVFTCVGWQITLCNPMLKVEKVKRYSSPEQVVSQLRRVTCHMGSHSVTCHLTQVNTPRLNPSQIGCYLINPTELTLVTGYIPRRFSCPQAVTHPSTNRTQCRLTTLIEANVLTTTLCCHPSDK